jgi:transposase
VKGRSVLRFATEDSYAVDARTLRAFAHVLARHEDRAKYSAPMLEQAREQLAELMTRRRQLVDMRAAEHNRQEHAGALSARSIRSVIKLLDSVKGGVGPVSIQTSTAALPELGRLQRRQIAKLVGVALLADDSGKRQGKRSIWGGRAALEVLRRAAPASALR